jgi:HK97 family phage portal protein
MWPFRTKTRSAGTAMKSMALLMGMSSYRGTGQGASYDVLAHEGYAINAIANACINRIANSIASIDRKLYKKTKGGKLTLIDNHALLDLLARPNPSMSGDEFMRALISYRQIGGNAYIYGNGIDPNSRNSKPPSELQLLMPGKVKIEKPKPDAILRMFPLSYEYKPDASAPANIYPVDPITGRSAILHLKTFNPIDPWLGMPPMLAAAYSLDINNGSHKWNKKLIDNDCRPAGALVMTGKDGASSSMTETQFTRLKEEVEESFSGPNNAGRPLILEGGLDWKQLSANPKDMDFGKGLDSSARDIGLVFGVPAQLLGIPGSSTYANFEQANLGFWTDTVLPLNDLILDALNRWLVPLYGDNLVLKYDPETIQALEPLRKAKADRIKESNYLTMNEKRKAMGHDDLVNKEAGTALLLDGRGILLGEDGTVISLTATQVDPNLEAAPGTPPAKLPAKPAKVPPEKFIAMLIEAKYDQERIERLAKLIYG